jgi:hypothetical protein
MLDRLRSVRVAAMALGLVAAGVFAPQAAADEIDLNDFFTDPSSAVSITADGSSATLTEDPDFFSVLLSNDPGLGDPHVIFGGADISLRFDYEFTEGAGESDEFSVFLINADTGEFMDAPYAFSTRDTGAGTITWDLSAFGSTTLGLQFELVALPGDGGLGSTLVISNLETFSTAATPIPEPGTIVLLGSAGAGMWFARRRRRRQERAQTR